MIHLLLNKNNIKHFILNNDDELKNYIDDKFLLNVDWLGLAKDYPDEFEYLHTSPEGHKIVYNRILKKMKLIYE
jgi:hypothetical protein